MPLYEYECAKDGRFELIRRFSDPPLKKCPKCGGRVEKLASAPAFHLKGTGWYATDYAKKSTKGGDENKTESKSAEAKKDDKKEASKASDSSGTKDSSGSKDAKDSAKATSTKESPAAKGSSPT